MYFRYARQALHDLAEGRRAIHDVQDLSRGALRIAVTPTFTTYLVGPLVDALHGRYPDVSLSVRVAKSIEARATLNRRATNARQLYPRIATAATSGRSSVPPTSDVVGSSIAA